MENLKDSPFYQNLLTNTGKTINDKALAGCICKCIRPKTIKECACPICTSLMLLVKAWHAQRREWHKEASCTCVGCKDMDARARYFAASSSLGDLGSVWHMTHSTAVSHAPNSLFALPLVVNTVCCPKVPHPHLILPHLPKNIPHFRQLGCCKKNGRIPSHVQGCGECGWEKRMYTCPVENTSDPAHYMRWEQTELPGEDKKGKKKYTKVLREVQCTRRVLLHAITSTLPAVVYHLWIDAMTKHMQHLDVATFDGNTAIVVMSDFAAAAKLQAAYTATCEWPTTANQCVALVLHSPSALEGNGKPRKVKCDYWRAWSDAKAGEQFHQMLMRDIASYYKTLIPTLRKMKCKTDGCSHQYKGFRNFFMLATFHLSEQSPQAAVAALSAMSATATAASKKVTASASVALREVRLAPLDKGGASRKCLAQGAGSWVAKKAFEMGAAAARGAIAVQQRCVPVGITQENDFPASHHYCGPHDNAGKVPRVGMRRDEGFENARIYDYDKCYGWCVQNMPTPSKRTDEKGTWACSGIHQWRCYSSGTDMYKHTHPNIPPKSTIKHSGVPGSAERYSYRGLAIQATSSLPACVESKFMQCYCLQCRSGHADHCKSRADFGDWIRHTLKETVSRRTGAGAGAGAGGAARASTAPDAGEEGEVCTECGSADDGGGDASRAMLLCDGCDSGRHLYCLPQPLQSPPAGEWHCPSCLHEQQRSSHGGVEDEAGDGGRDDEISCAHCTSTDGDASMLLCDGEDCSDAWHMGCLPTPLSEIPAESWLCPVCSGYLDSQIADVAAAVDAVHAVAAAGGCVVEVEKHISK